MQSIFNIGLLTTLWVVNLFNNTGLDAVYHVTDIAKIVVIILTLFSVASSFQKKGDIRITSSDFNAFGGMALIFVGSSFLQGQGFQALDYLWVFCLTYLISKIDIDSVVMKRTGLIYGFLGAVILLIYNYGSLLKGWNENSIAMLGMHSFLVAVIPFFDQTSSKTKLTLLIVGIVFAFLIWPTNSRSAILFFVVAGLFALNMLSRSIVIGKGNRLVLLLSPIFIVLFCWLITKAFFFDSLDLWSMRTFQKPIFNGRDQIWTNGLKMLLENLFFGCGNLITNNWHNSAIHCLTAYGILGYGFWIRSFYKILDTAQEHFSDSLVCGAYVAFIILWIQQSVELGLISHTPSLLPYIILGIMLGRINFLRKEQEILHIKEEQRAQNQYNNPRI